MSIQAASEIFTQRPYRCRFDWGCRGCAAAAQRGDVIVLIDVLRFCSAVATAVHHGVSVYPCAGDQDPMELAHRVKAEAAMKNEAGAYSLSPLCYVHAEPGTRVVLGSANGGACSRWGNEAPHFFAAGLLNARASALAVSQILSTTTLAVTVVAAGERWAEESSDGPIRFAVEDYLAAGAVLSYLRFDKSPEAAVCEGAFLHSRNNLLHALRDSASGRELVARGAILDIEHAARLNLYDTAPVLREGAFIRA